MILWLFSREQIIEVGGIFYDPILWCNSCSLENSTQWQRNLQVMCQGTLCTSPLLYGNNFLCPLDVRPPSGRQVKKIFVHTFVFMDSSHCLHSWRGRNKTFKVCSLQWILRAKVDPYCYHFTDAFNLCLPHPNSTFSVNLGRKKIPHISRKAITLLRKGSRCHLQVLIWVFWAQACIPIDTNEIPCTDEEFGWTEKLAVNPPS